MSYQCQESTSFHVSVITSWQLAAYANLSRDVCLHPVTRSVTLSELDSHQDQLQCVGLRWTMAHLLSTTLSNMFLFIHSYLQTKNFFSHEPFTSTEGVDALSLSQPRYAALCRQTLMLERAFH